MTSAAVPVHDRCGSDDAAPLAVDPVMKPRIMSTSPTAKSFRRGNFLRVVFCSALTVTLVGLWLAVARSDRGWIVPCVLGVSGCALLAAMFRDVQRTLWGGSMLGHLLAVVFFGQWLIQTDVLFGHHMGPPRLLIASAVTSASGIGGTLFWALWHIRESQTGGDQPPGRSWRAILGAWVVCLSMIPSGVIAWVGVQSFPKARTQMTLDEINRIAREHDPASAPSGPAKPSKGASEASDVATLMAAMEDKDANVRYIALSTLARIGSSAKPARPRLEQILDSHLHGAAAKGGPVPDSNVACALAAITALGNMGSDAQDALPLLLESARLPRRAEGLNRDNESVRTTALQALAKIGPEGAAAAAEIERRHRAEAVRDIPSIVRQLTHTDVAIRVAAAEELSSLGANALPAVATLGAMVVDDREASVRFAAASALGNIGPSARDAVPALTAGLKDPDADVRRASGWALQHIEVGAKP